MSAPSSLLDTLHDLGLVTAAQRDAGLAHPRLSELAPGTSPADALLWLMLRDIVSEADFATTDERLISRHSGDDYRLRRTLVDDVKVKLRQARQHLNQATLQSLLDEGLISPALHATLAPQVPQTDVWASPAAALVWLRWNDHLSEEDWQAVKAQVARQAGFASSRGAAEVMAQADALLAQTRQAAYKAAKSLFWRAVLPGPPWLWAGGLVLLIGFAVWRIATPATLPACDAKETVSAVNGMLFKAHVKARSDVLHGGLDLPAGMPTVHQIKEVGHDTVRQARGCTSTIEVAGDKIPYAYVIEASKSSEGGDPQFRVVGADVRVVQTRFGHLDREGRPLQQAEPIGRANLEQALRAGVDALNQQQAGSRNRAMERMLAQRRERRDTAPEREREIAEVEPTGGCREAGVGGTRYSCPLLIERNDPLLDALGAGSLTLIEGDFTFERDTPGSTSWRVSSDFAREYRDAIVKGRLQDARP